MPALAPDDAVVATYREHGHALARGVAAGRRSWPRCSASARAARRGRGGSMHLFDAATRFYGGNAIVGGGLPDRRRPRAGRLDAAARRVTACFFGEGAVAEGEFHESMNLAALWRLPVLFCCENNLYAMGTALARSESQTDLCVKAASYGMPALAGRRHGRASRWRARRATRRCARARGRRPGLPRAPHLPLPRALDVRPGALSRQGRGRARGRSAIRSTRFAARAARARARSTTRRSRGARAPRSRARSTRAVAFAEAGTWEPVDGPAALRRRRSAARHERAQAHLPRGRCARRSARRSLRDERVFLMGEDVGPLRRQLRGQQGPARRVRARAHPRHAALGVGASSARASARRSAACGRSSRS